jgi:hypothetical protein
MFHPVTVLILESIQSLPDRHLWLVEWHPVGYAAEVLNVRN